MGIPVPFIELPLPLEESAFATSLVKVGLAGDMLGCPDREGGHRLAWMVEGAEGRQVAALEAMLRQSYEQTHTVELDLARGRWIGTGKIADDALRSPALDAYIDVEDRFEAPWIHVDGGKGWLRLLPRSDMELFVDMGRLKEALAPRKVRQEPEIRHFSLRRYDHLRDTLRQAVLDAACRGV